MAGRIYQKLIREKKTKGYQEGDVGQTHTSVEREGEDSGIRCQLLNPIEEAEAERLLRDDRWCAQEKFDGRRLLVRKAGSNVIGINRRGLFIPAPSRIVEAALQMPFDFLIDGEAVRDTIHVFDLLEFRGADLRSMPYRDRLTYMVRWVDDSGFIRFIPTACATEGKVNLFRDLRARDAEGIVSKDLDAAYAADRPNSGGSQLKLKFHATASFIVGAVHARKRSVGLGLIDGKGTIVPTGNVTIPPNHDIPQTGAIVEFRYLYAFPESGSVYQPVYLGRRNDIEPRECVTTQLKYRPSTVGDAA